MGARYLADTNALIDLVLDGLPQAGATWLDTQIIVHQVAISVITRIELLGKIVPTADFDFLQALVQSVEVLPLNEPVIQQTIRLRQQRRVKLPDAIIAATALAHGLTFLTRNVADFKAIVGLSVLDLHNAPQLPDTPASTSR